MFDKNMSEQQDTVPTTNSSVMINGRVLVMQIQLLATFSPVKVAFPFLN